MEGRSAVWLLLLMEALISAEAQNSVKYFEVGGKLVLQPELFSGSITSITWKLNENIVGLLDEGQKSVQYAPAFSGRANVDTTTGVLEISSITKTDSGVYKVVINNKIQEAGYDVKVIKQVPKPEINVRPLTCSKESKSCSLSCIGDITEAEPLTFYFRKDDGNWEEGGQNIEISAKDNNVEKFSCQMKNPLGQKDSDPVDNPFYEKDNTGLIVGVVLVVLALVGAAGGGVFMYQKKQNSGNITDTTGSSTKDKRDQEAPLSPDV